MSTYSIHKHLAAGTALAITAGIIQAYVNEGAKHDGQPATIATIEKIGEVIDQYRAEARQDDSPEQATEEN